MSAIEHRPLAMKAAKAAKEPKPWTGRHLLYALLGFFGVMLVANVIFITLALDTFTGVTNKNAYQDGLNYNQRLEAAAAQQALGWTGALTVESGQLSLALNDAQGAAVTGLTLQAELRRPTNEIADITLPLQEMLPGVYGAALDLPYKGNWNLMISGQAADGTPFETRTRLWLD
ncbi:MAG: FixH family protein [Pseudomonadota bacterium]